MKNIAVPLLALSILSGCSSVGGDYQLYERERYYSSKAQDIATHAGITLVEDTPIIIINNGLKRSGSKTLESAVMTYDMLAPTYQSMAKSQFNKLAPTPDGYLGFFPLKHFPTREDAEKHFKREILLSFNRILPEYNFVEFTDDVSEVSSTQTYTKFTMPDLTVGEMPDSLGGGQGWLWKAPFSPKVTFIGAVIRNEDLESLRQSLLFSKSKYIYRYLGAFEKRFPQIVGDGKVHYFISEP